MNDAAEVEFGMTAALLVPSTADRAQDQGHALCSASQAATAKHRSFRRPTNPTRFAWSVPSVILMLEKLRRKVLEQLPRKRTILKKDVVKIKFGMTAGVLVQNTADRNQDHGLAPDSVSQAATANHLSSWRAWNPTRFAWNVRNAMLVRKKTKKRLNYLPMTLMSRRHP
jgi:hypothetical protein